MIITYPNKILLTPSSDVSLEEAKVIDAELREHIRNLNWGECVGLAAPQIGLNKNVFIALGRTYINPKIISRSPVTHTKIEGCYSLTKNKSYKVTRHLSIEMEFENLAGKKKTKRFQGLDAQVLQHEYDHLQGKLCISYA